VNVILVNFDKHAVNLFGPQRD